MITTLASPNAASAVPPVGHLLREWRQRRRLSQLDLALEADISSRHLSFMETGRAQPSREMLLHLAEQLEVPLRDRNVLLTAAGFAPVFAERSLLDPALTAARDAVELVLKGHEPYPAIAVDRHWLLSSANTPALMLMAGVDEELVKPPINVLRVSLHPKGLAPRIANLGEWRAHLLARLKRQIETTGDAVLSALLEELSSYPAPRERHGAREVSAIAVPLQLKSDAGIMSFFSTITVFGTPVDITLSEIAIEAFFPADQATGDILRRMSAQKS
ncbi:helix-turn-helix transcriptional regulator [Terrarubrum flagellatum]|uniref:helix-turn-helix domain-containing protein n=1 Tax=Terrirubrum flagellatum TaxID=2895980 RepID=UPI00314569B3